MKSLPRILPIQASSFRCRPAIDLSVAHEMALTIAVPLGTCAGWNVYRAQLCELGDRTARSSGLPGTKGEAAGDRRPSLEERYGSCAACVA